MPKQSALYYNFFLSKQKKEGALLLLLQADPSRWTNALTANFPEIVAPFVTFAIVYAQAGTVNVAQAFTSLAIIMLLTGNLAQLLSSIPQFAASLGSFDRIQGYLLSSERLDTRNLLQDSPGFGDIPKDDAEAAEPKSAAHDQMLEIHSLSKDTMVTIGNGSFGEPEVLRDINIGLPKSSLTMVVGPIGSGKSMLLKAILGELLPSKGSIHIKSTEVAYCAQEPWLINKSIRQNIIGPSSNHEKDAAWYRTVTSACGLDADIASFPEGDELVVGSGGIRLSGGQKQRVV